jgi:Uma2 family endonuclease
MIMTQTAPRLSTLMTMEDYLAYDDGTDTRYELVDGVLVEMPVESQSNAAILRRRGSAIARFLLFELAKYIPLERLAHKDTEIEVTGRRSRCRVPDLLDSFRRILHRHIECQTSGFAARYATTEFNY